jgi:hypothetical protein
MPPRHATLADIASSGGEQCGSVNRHLSPVKVLSSSLSHVAPSALHVYQPQVAMDSGRGIGLTRETDWERPTTRARALLWDRP